MREEKVARRAARQDQWDFNYLRHLHRCGCRCGDHILLLGEGRQQVLAAVAKIVGVTGSITVVDQNPALLADVTAAAKAGQFISLQPLANVHPAFDLRPPAERYRPVCVTTHLLTQPQLPFPTDHFAMALVVPDAIAGADHERLQLDAELARVLRPKGRLVHLSDNGSFSLQARLWA